jgi:hypothetical protein
MPMIALIVLFALLTSTYSLAATVMLDVSVTSDIRKETARFEILFSGKPNFHKVDRFGRQEDAFQFEIDGPGVGRAWPFETLIRGSEIYLDGDIRVRDVEPAIALPEAGGWGALRGSVGYSVSERQVTFEVPFEMLGAPTGVFSYLAFSTNYGQWNGDEFKGSVVPLPAPGILILAGIAALGAIGRHRGRARQR